MQKSASAYKTISEVSEMLDIPAHVLRFWESKFSQLKPMKRSGGRRYYRLEDIALLETIKSLLYVEGYTIKGAQGSLSKRRKADAVTCFTGGGGAKPGCTCAFCAGFFAIPATGGQPACQGPKPYRFASCPYIVFWHFYSLFNGLFLAPHFTSGYNLLVGV